MLRAEQRRTQIDRDDLERFLFAEDDLVIVVGQDGLVANVAKYLRGQPVLGVNPDPATYDGVLCRYGVKDLPAFAPLFVRFAFGLPLLTWTVRSEADRKRARRYASQMIFEGFRP